MNQMSEGGVRIGRLMNELETVRESKGVMSK